PRSRPGVTSAASQSKQALRLQNSRFRPRIRSSPVSGSPCSLFRRLRWQLKEQELNQDFSTSTKVFPMRAGDGDTLIPAASMAAILESASPVPPELIHP